MAYRLHESEQRQVKKSEWVIELACLYGPSALLLPGELQMQLWRGKDKAKAHLQSIHWDTRMDDYNMQRVHDVYQELHGAERADAIVAKMSRSKKESEANKRLDDA